MGVSSPPLCATSPSLNTLADQSLTMHTSYRLILTHSFEGEKQQKIAFCQLI